MAFTFGKIDKSRELDGSWVDGEDGTSFLIARWGNEAQQAMVVEERKKLGKRSIDKMAPKKAIDFMCRLIAECVLLDWRDVKDVNDKKVPYSKDAALSWLKDDDEFRSWVQAESENEEHYYREKVADAKNS